MVNGPGVIPSSTTSNGNAGPWRPKFAATSDNFYSDSSKKGSQYKN